MESKRTIKFSKKESLTLMSDKFNKMMYKY